MSKLRKVFITSLLVLFTSSLAVNAIASQDWDVDNSGEVDALTDGLLILRFAFGLRGEALYKGSISTTSPLTPAEVEAEIVYTQSIFDIDGDGNYDALTDGLLLLRYLFGLSGDALLNGGISSGATRSTEQDVSVYIQSYMPNTERHWP